MKPIQKILLAVLLGVMISSLFSFMLDKGLVKYYSHTHNKFKSTFIDNTNYDLLFVGSSRVHNNINPKIVDSITGLKSFNAGTDGANAAEIKLIIEAYLEKHPAPKKIILGVDLFSFNTSNTLFNYTFYLPFYNNNKIDSTLNSLEHYTSVYKYLPFLKSAEYDDYAKSKAISGFASANEMGSNQIEYKGFASLGNDTIKENNVKLEKETVKLDSVGMQSVNDIAEICKKKNIDLILFYAPEYKAMWQNKVSNSNNVFNTSDSISKKNNIAFLRYDTISICQKASLFHNVRHLNNDGANQFSEIIANQLIK